MEISEGSDVWITTNEWITTNGQRLEGQVSQSVDTPRSYVIVTPRGTQLNVAPAIAQESNEQSNTTNTTNSSEPPDSNPEVPRRIMTRSQTGTVVHPPERLTYT